jgi:hypothetical protein
MRIGMMEKKTTGQMMNGERTMAGEKKRSGD